MQKKKEIIDLYIYFHQIKGVEFIYDIQGETSTLSFHPVHCSTHAVQAYDVSPLHPIDFIPYAPRATARSLFAPQLSRTFIIAYRRDNLKLPRHPIKLRYSRS